MYSLRGRTATTTATIGDAVFGFWNPHSTQIIRLIDFVATVQGIQVGEWHGGTWRRTTARGTAATTVTPDISNDSRRGAAPPSGALLDTSFSVQPTLEADDWGPTVSTFGANSAAGVGAAYRFPGSGLYIPPGTGIALIQTEAVAVQPFEISLSWLED
jgi:hypothetical protein